MAEPEKGHTEAQVKNIVTVTDAGPCKKKISVEIPEEAIKKAFDEQYKELSKDALVPGFRKGRAPRRLLEKRFGKEVSDQVKLKLLADASESAVKDNELDMLGEPDIKHEEIELPETGTMKFEFEVEVKPDFELPELEAIPVEKPKIKVSEAQVKESIVEFQKRLGTWAPKKDGIVAADNQVFADIVIKPEDGEEEKFENQELTVRANGFVGKVLVEKLDELLIGAKAGDIKETTVDVASTFYDENLRGRKVAVKIKINEVRELAAAELNDEFFTKLGVEDEDELNERLRERAQEDIEQRIREAMQESVYDYLLKNTEFDLPADVVADQSEQLLKRQYTRLLMQGQKPEEVSELMEKLRAGTEEQARRQLKTFFIMDKIANKLEIQADEEEINGYIARAAMQRRMRPDKMREQMMRDGSLSQFALEVTQQKCIEKLLETAKIKEVSPKKDSAAKKPAKKKTTAKEKNKEKPVRKKTTAKKESAE
ncbi:MAG: trigger factor [Planctomycetes bacterium]|nr:trigger factor [Planctomycetota bacterium]